MPGIVSALRSPSPDLVVDLVPQKVLWNFCLRLLHPESASNQLNEGGMIALSLVRLIERNSDELAAELVVKLETSSHTTDLRKVPVEELRGRNPGGQSGPRAANEFQGHSRSVHAVRRLHSRSQRWTGREAQ